jgi:proprotein convertase subtilisin/kexin type 5
MGSGNICLSECPSRYYPNTTSRSCLSCPFDCYTCLGNGGCLSCNSTTDFRTFNSSTQRCAPIDGYFENSTTVAAQCPLSCLACTSLSNCDSCVLGNFLRKDAMCYTDCLPRTYGQSQTLVCLDCPSDCYTCDSFGACLSCNNSYDHRVLNSSTKRCVPANGYY